MTVERTINGYWHIYTMHKGYLVRQTYIGYTKREAIAEFKAHLRSL